MTPDRVTSIHNFLRNLVTATSNAALYSLDHPQVDLLCRTALQDIGPVVAEGDGLSLLLIDDELIADGVPLESNLYLGRFAQALKLRGVGHLKIVSGVTVEELRLLAENLRKGSRSGEIRSTAHIRFGKVEVRFARQDEGGGNTDELRQHALFQEMSDEELVRLMEIYEGVQKHRKLKVVGINEIVSGFIKTFKNQLDPLLAISPLKALDEYTFTHSTNVCILNLAQAMALGIEGQLLHDIGIAAMLHDMGKLFIPEEILVKPGELDEKEWALMRQHPVRGAMYLLNSPGVPQLAVLNAFEHHMRYDGTGYPSTYKGWRQHLCSQMTAVSDTFDALRSERCYQGAMEYDVIATIMGKLAGSQLNPLLVRNFLGILHKASKF
jgi:HD-GYP domain-containing protein (c-di-GMP phosphodiesterase class II)